MPLMRERVRLPDRRRWPWQKRRTTLTPPGGWCSEHWEGACHKKKKKTGWMSIKIKTEQAPVKLCKKLNSHDQMLAGRLLSFLLGLTFSLVTYTPYPGRHHQHQGVQAGHACTRGQQWHFIPVPIQKNWWIEPFHAWRTKTKHSTVSTVLH